MTSHLKLGALPPRRPVTAEEIAQFIKLARSGKTRKQIAEELNRSETAIGLGLCDMV
jgi:DNA-binding NarL/FixJ family response regulator